MPRQVTRQQMIDQLVNERGRDPVQAARVVDLMIEHKLVRKVRGTEEYTPTRLGDQYWRENRHKLQK